MNGRLGDGLPEAHHARDVEEGLVRQQGHALRQRLGDEQPVERVLVRELKAAGERRVADRDGEGQEALP